MQHRINLFVMFVTCIGLLALTGRNAAGIEGLCAQLPGGRESMPGFTSAVLIVVGWLSRWWPLCMLLGAGAAFGGPALLRRTPAGERWLVAAGRWMTNYHATVLVLFVAAMFTTYWAIDLALSLPWLRIMEQLTAR